MHKTSEQLSTNPNDNESWQSVANLAKESPKSKVETNFKTEIESEQNQASSQAEKFTNDFLEQNPQIDLTKLNDIENIFLNENKPQATEDTLILIGVATGIKPAGTIVNYSYGSPEQDKLAEKIRAMGLVALTNDFTVGDSEAHELVISANPDTAKDLLESFTELRQINNVTDPNPTSATDKKELEAKIGHLLGYPDTAINRYNNDSTDPVFRFFSTPAEYRQFYTHSQDHAYEEYNQYEAKLYDATEKLCPETWERWTEEHLHAKGTAAELAPTPPTPQEVLLQQKRQNFLASQTAIDQLEKQISELDHQIQASRNEITQFNQSHNFFRRHFGKTAKELYSLQENLNSNLKAKEILDQELAKAREEHSNIIASVNQYAIPSFSENPKKD